MSNLLPPIERLKGRENFDAWKFAVQNFLEHEELWLAVIGTETDAKKLIKAKSKLILMLDPIIYVHVKNAKTAKEVWDNLILAFEDSGLTRKVGLLRSLLTTNLSNCASIEDYVNKIILTSHKLNSIGMIVSDEWIGTILLAGLPDRYKPMIMALESSAITISADLIKTKLLQDTEQLESGSDDVAFFGNSSKKRFKTKDKQMKSSGPRCFNCNAFGHIARNCPNKSNSTGDNNKPNVLYTSFMAKEANKNDWYVDSGASSHMTMNKNWLEDYEQLDHEQQVTAANNTKLTIKGKGNIKIDVSVNNAKREVKILNVLYVPEICANLLSVSQMTNNGNTVSFDNVQCKIFNKNKQLIVTAFKIGEMFKVNKHTDFNFNVTRNLSFNLWHRRMGHTSTENLKLLKEDFVPGLNCMESNDEPCTICIEGKHSKIPFNSSNSKTTEALQIIHSDVCGPIEKCSLGGARYFLTFIDDFTHKVFVYILKTKSEVTSKFVEFKEMVENQLNKKIKILRTDNGTEFVNADMSKFLKSNGIIHQKTAPYTPQQNGKAERMNRTLVEKARCLLYDAKLSKEYWAEAICTATYLINRLPSRSIIKKTPEDMWSGIKPNLENIRVFGCLAMVYIPKQKRKKLDAKSEAGIFIGYCENNKAYRIYNPKNKKITISRDVKFMENSQYEEVNIHKNTVINYFDLPADSNKNLTKIDATDIDADPVIAEITENEFSAVNDIGVCDRTLTDTDTQPILQMDESTTSVYYTDSEPETDIHDQKQRNSGELMENSVTRRSERTPKPKKFDDFVSYMVNHLEEEPSTYEEAIHRFDSAHWREAIKNEFESLKFNNTWKIAELPKNEKAIPSKWIFKIKKNSKGEIGRYKARLVAKGCAQRKGLDYDETYSPVIRYTSVRFLLALSAKLDLDIDHMDAITAFLQGELKENIYIIPPEGYENLNGKVLKLNKSIYGLKQSSRLWNQKLDKTLKEIGMAQSRVDPCIYFRLCKAKLLIVAVYVDDLLVFTNCQEFKTNLKTKLQDNFNMKDLGAATSFLGISIERNRKEGKIWINQEQYINNMLNRFGMTNSNVLSTPLDMNQKLSRKNSPKSQDEKDEMINVPYQELVGSLLFAAQVSRPDISYAVNFISRFNNDPGKLHWMAAKRILRYLKGSSKAKLCYSNNTQSGLVGYCDADFASDADDCRSVTSYAFLMSGGAISWKSQKQPTVALSTTESEYMALGSAVKEALWLKSLENELMGDTPKIVLNCDNQSAICLASNECYQARTKHIDVRHHFVRESLNRGQISLQHIHTENMLADLLTKALPCHRTISLSRNMGMQFKEILS